MRRILTILIILFSFSCTETKKTHAGHLQTIQIGDYLFDFPLDYKLIEEEGIDSYVGHIKGKDMFSEFDFGFYSSDFEQTVEEFLKNGNWKAEIPLRFLKDNVIYDDTNMPKIEILSIRQATAKEKSENKKCDFVAECKYENRKFIHSITIPEDIKSQNFKIDTIKNCYRKIVFSSDTKNGTTGIYLANMSRAKALSLSTSNLTKEQQKTALKIFNTGRPKI